MMDSNGIRETTARPAALVVAAPQFCGLAASVGKELSKRFDVAFSCSEFTVARAVRRVWGEPAPPMQIMAERLPVLRDADDVLAECRRYEEKYRTRFSLMCSYDRALGKGYLLNVDRHPDIARSWWPMEGKYAEILACFRYWEGLFETFRPRFMFAFAQTPIMEAVAAAYGAPIISLASAKMEDYWFFSDCPRYTSQRLLARMRELAAEPLPEKEEALDVGLDAQAALFLPSARPTYGQAARQTVSMALHGASARLKGLAKKDSYGYLAWVPSLFRKVRAYDHLCRHGKRPGELAGRRMVVVPLHMEPEIALMVFSPEFTNSVEMVVWLSKCLPADTVLVVKEHPLSFGVRSLQFYDLVRRMPNVVLAHPEPAARAWIDAADALATITSTMGVEAVLAGKPVISFGPSQAINTLPCVRFAGNFAETRAAVAEVLAGTITPDDFARSRRAYIKAHVDEGFRIPDVAPLTRSVQPAPQQARIIVDRLRAQRPELFAGTEAREEVA